MKRIRSLALATVGFLPLALSAAYAQPMGGRGMMGNSGPIEVGVISAEKVNIPITQTLAGRVAASEVADIRPQVGGIIKQVAFEDGQFVEQGQLLFTVQAESYEAALSSAKANLTKVQAAEAAAQAKVDRYKNLSSGSGVSKVELADAEVALLQAHADVQASQASVQAAQINLNQTEIRSPIDGILGVSAVSEGDLVSANQTTALVTVRQLNPVNVMLVDSSRNLLDLRKRTTVKNGSADDLPQVTLILEDGSRYDHKGVVELTELVVNEATGTFSLRAKFPNPDMLLLPGIFVRAEVELGTSENAYLVPQRAVSRNANGSATAYFVGAENKAEQRVIEATRTYNNAWVIIGGIVDGDQLIVDGLQKFQNGSQIIPVPVEISANGVIIQDMTKVATPPAAPAGSAPAGGRGN